MPKKQIKKEEVNRKTGSGLWVPAGLLIGMGFGFLYNQLVPGLFIGLGVGFLIFAILKSLGR